MANEILVGQAVLHGIQNDGSAITINKYATFIMTKISAQHMFELKKVKNELDFTTAAVSVDEGADITIDLTISGGTSGTRTSAAATGIFPAPLTKITLSHVKIQTAFETSNNTSGATGTKIFDGDYSYEGGTTIDLNNADFAKLSGIKLRKYADSAQNVSMTTAITG
jgi:hypothetical protein